MNRDIVILREVVTKLTQMLAGMGLKVTQQGTNAFVQFDEVTQRPTRVNIPFIPDNASEELILAIQGFIDHEVSHILHSDFTVLSAANKENKQLGVTLNIVEDPFIERKMGERFPGAVYNLSRLHEFFIKHVTEVGVKNAETPMDQFAFLIVAAVRAWSGQTAFKEYLDRNNYWDHPIMKGFVERLPASVIARMPKIKSTAESLEIAREILKAMSDEGGGLCGEDEDGAESGSSRKSRGSKSKASKGGKSSKEKSEDKDEKREEGESEKKSAASSEDKDEDKDDEGEDSDKDDDEEGDGEDEDSSDDTDDEEGDDKDDDEEGDDKDEDSSDDTDEGEDGKGSDEDGDEDEDGDGGKGDGDKEDEVGGKREMEVQDESTAFMPADFEKALSDVISKYSVDVTKGSDYRVFTKDFDKIEPYEPSYHADPKWVVNLEEKTRAMVGSMQKSIERMMAARSQVLKTPGFRSGRLHAAGLYRLATGDDRVFRRQIESRSKDVAVSILIDNSGSMGGSRMRTAMMAGFALSQTLERVGIQHEVLGFTTGTGKTFMKGFDPEVIMEEQRRIGIRYSRWEALYMPIFKGFQEKLTPTVKLRFADAAETQNFLANNVDGECVEVAARRLMGRREKRKVLIVLSDGMPACDGINYELANHLKRTVNECEKMGVETIGIGIETDAVRTFYPKYIVLDDLSALPTTVMDQLRKILV